MDAMEEPVLTPLTLLFAELLTDLDTRIADLKATRERIRQMQHRAYQLEEA